jgi:hypothetical protein
MVKKQPPYTENEETGASGVSSTAACFTKKRECADETSK